MARPKGAHAAPKPSGNARFRKIRALLASGLVLGVGATLTLSSWNDAEHATSELKAGFFEIEGSTTGQPGSYRESSEERPHALTFTPQAGQMYPGVSTYGLFSVRARSESLGGTLQLQAPQWNRQDNDSLGRHLTYGVRVTEGTTCSAQTFTGSSTVVVSSGTPLSSTAPAGSRQTLQPDEGAPVNYCFQLTLPANAENAAQGRSVTPRWQVQGTSTVEP